MKFNCRHYLAKIWLSKLEIFTCFIDRLTSSNLYKILQILNSHIKPPISAQWGVFYYVLIMFIVSKKTCQGYIKLSITN